MFLTQRTTFSFTSFCHAHAHEKKEVPVDTTLIPDYQTGHTLGRNKGKA
jgi:hypothetical protein